MTVWMNLLMTRAKTLLQKRKMTKNQNGRQTPAATKVCINIVLRALMSNNTNNKINNNSSNNFTDNDNSLWMEKQNYFKRLKICNISNS